jgi:predicted alpha/beta-hydrolase family hydrolase
MPFVSESNPEVFSLDIEGRSPVRGFLHSASGAKDALVLTHGAGGNSRAPLLVSLADEFSRRGVTTLRCDLPFRQKRPKGPPSPGSAKEDQEGLRAAIAALRERVTGRVFLGGQSYGGRQASMLAASDGSLADALLLLSYPLLPPGRPTQLRTAHLPKLQTPTLIVQGTKDPFGSPAEIKEAHRLIPAKNQLFSIEGAGHSLDMKRNRTELAASIVETFLTFVAG